MWLVCRGIRGENLLAGIHLAIDEGYLECAVQGTILREWLSKYWAGIPGGVSEIDDESGKYCSGNWQYATGPLGRLYYGSARIPRYNPIIDAGRSR
jgi:hypothetical protein